MPCFPIVGKNEKWPTGKSGDLTVNIDTHIDVDLNTLLDYRNVTVNNGATLWVNSTDGYPILFGVAGNLTLNGTGSIRIVEKLPQNSAWPLSTLLTRKVKNNGGTASWNTPPAKVGGAGAGNGYTGTGGSQASGFGGGGGGGDLYDGAVISGGNGGNAGSNGTDGSKFDGGGSTAYAGVGGTNSVLFADGGDGSYQTNLAYGGAGGGRVLENILFWLTTSQSGGGGGGAASAYGGGSWSLGAGGGGAGGVPGRNGACGLVIVRGIISGSGSIIASGTDGTNGSKGGDAYGSGTGKYVHGGSGGGGGGGGHGGAVTLFHNSQTVSISLIAAKGNKGLGGDHGQGALAGGQSGSNGDHGTDGLAGYAFAMLS